MSTPVRWPGRPCLAYVLPATLALLTLGFPRPGVWLDEAATASATSRTWEQLWHLSEHQDRALVGYYAATKALADLSGYSPLAAGRFISAAGYVGATAIVSMIAVRLFGHKAGMIAEQR